MNEMIEKKSWEEFRDNGFIWFVNTLLHIFGWCLVVEMGDETDKTKITSVYPARTKFRGFNEKSNEAGYIKLSQYMKENAEKLLEEAKD
jgi:hypothetical protein